MKWGKAWVWKKWRRHKTFQASWQPCHGWTMPVLIPPPNKSWHTHDKQCSVHSIVFQVIEIFFYLAPCLPLGWHRPPAFEVKNCLNFGLLTHPGYNRPSRNADISWELYNWTSTNRWSNYNCPEMTSFRTQQPIFYCYQSSNAQFWRISCTWNPYTNQLTWLKGEYRNFFHSFIGPVGHNIWWENSQNGSFGPEKGPKTQK